MQIKTSFFVACFYVNKTSFFVSLHQEVLIFTNRIDKNYDKKLKKVNPCEQSLRTLKVAQNWYSFYKTLRNNLVTNFAPTCEKTK